MKTALIFFEGCISNKWIDPEYKLDKFGALKKSQLDIEMMPAQEAVAFIHALQAEGFNVGILSERAGIHEACPAAMKIREYLCRSTPKPWREWRFFVTNSVRLDNHGHDYKLFELRNGEWPSIESVLDEVEARKELLSAS